VKHALIVGARGVGKSTLISRVLEELKCPVVGFETKKEEAQDGQPGWPVYLYEVGKARVQSRENLVGRCGNRCLARCPEVFDRYAVTLREPAAKGCVVKLDELGFLESASEAFCGAVLEKLEGDAPVIAAVKDRDTPFLRAVRSHPKAVCFFITEDNRDGLYREVLAFMREQMSEEELS